MMLRVKTKSKRFSHKLLVALVATSAVAMSADLPDTVRPDLLNLKSSVSISEQQLAELISQSSGEQLDTHKQPHSLTVKRYTVKQGDSLGRIWARFGGTLDRAKAALQELRSIGNSAHTLRVGDTLSLLVNNTSGEIRGFRRRLDDGSLVVLRDKVSGDIESSVKAPVITESERTVAGTIYSSLSKAAHEKNIPPEIVDDLVDIFGNRIDFRKDLRVGNTFSLIYKEHKNEKGALIKVGSIIAASIEIDGKLHAAVRHQRKNGESIYYDENGQVQGEFFLRYPVQFTRISSVFTNSRFHPVLGKHRAHNGVDFSAPTGTPVRTIAAGVISEMGYDRGRGNFIKIQHDAKYSTEYFHLSKFSSGLKRGSRITKGSIIGGVGATGLATGPHLHFGFFINGKYTDPLKVKLPTEPLGGEKIPHGYLLAQLDTLKGQHQQIRLALAEKESQQG